MSYAFNLYIDPADIPGLVAQGFYFATVKTTGGSTTEVQWFAVLIEGEEINVSWNVDYEVFFTTTQIANGATIRQGSRYIAQTGQSYAYAQASWSPSTKGPSVDASQIGIYNDYPNSGIRNFGINQVVNIGGNSRRTPIAIAPVAFYQGTAKFQPREIVKLYFALKTWADDGTIGGVVVESVTAGITLTLVSGTPQYVGFKGGQWSRLPGPPNNFALSRALSAPPSWHDKVAFVLAAPVETHLFASWLEKKLKNLLARPHGPLISTEFQQEVISDKDRTAELLALKGTWYEEPLVLSVNEDGSEELKGRRVKILAVELARSVFDHFLALLPAKAAVHSH